MVENGRIILEDTGEKNLCVFTANLRYKFIRDTYEKNLFFI